MMDGYLEKVSFSREDLLHHLPVLEGLYKSFGTKVVIEWILKNGSADPTKDEREKKNEG